MKRLIAICLLLCSVISLVACSGIGVSEPSSKTDPTITSDPTGVQSTTLSTAKPTTRPTTPSTTEHSTQPTAQSTTQSDPCAFGHSYKDGWCIHCLAPDPDFDICANGHIYENGWCIHCLAPDPDFDICANGHTYENGWCVYCLNPDPNFDICANGHTYENGWCVYCLNPDPSVKPTTPPATMTEDEALQIATELLDQFTQYCIFGICCDAETIEYGSYYALGQITCCHSLDQVRAHIRRSIVDSTGEYIDESLFSYDDQGNMCYKFLFTDGPSYMNHRIVFYDDNTIIIDADASEEGMLRTERVTCIRKPDGFAFQKLEIISY